MKILQESDIINITNFTNDAANKGKTLYVSVNETLISSKNLKSALGHNSDYSAANNIFVENSRYKVNDTFIDVTIEPDYDIELKIKVETENYNFSLAGDCWSWSILPGNIINWNYGASNDEIAQNINNIAEATHVYSPGEYTIKIKNILLNASNGNSSNDMIKSGDTSIVAINFIKHQVVQNGKYLFANLGNLKSIKGIITISNSVNRSGVTNFMFHNCNQLSDISDFTVIYNTIGDGAPNALVQTFFGCSKLESEDIAKCFLNYKKETATTFNTTFRGCSSMKSIPITLVSNNVSNYIQAFYGTSIEYVPADIFDNATNMTETFRYSKVKYINPNIKLSKLSKASAIFAGCPLSFNSITALCNALPESPVVNDSTKEGYITFGYDINETDIENKLRAFFNISDEESLPSYNTNKYISYKGWKLAFENQ